MKKKSIILIILIAILAVGVVLICVKGDYMICTVSVNLEGQPVELSEKYIQPQAYYEDYEYDSVDSICWSSRLDNGFRIFEIRRIKDVPVEYATSANFNVDGKPVCVGVVLEDPVDLDPDPWITNINISLYYDENGELQQTATCSKGTICEIGSYESYGTYEVEYAPLAYVVRTDKNTKIRNIFVSVKND